MARYFDVHPVDPQRRAIGQIVDLVRGGGLVAYPTDSCYALGCQVGDREGIDRIRTIRKLDDRHHFTLMCKDFSQLGQFVGPIALAWLASRAGGWGATHWAMLAFAAGGAACGLALTRIERDKMAR